MARSQAISILGPDSEHPAFETVQGDDHLRLTFHDVASSTPGLTAPGAHDMAKLLGFIRAWDKQNSAAYPLLGGYQPFDCGRLYCNMSCCSPHSDESELALALRAASPSATPNPMLVALADDALGREGRMIRAIRSIGRGADAFEGAPFRLPL